MGQITVIFFFIGSSFFTSLAYDDNGVSMLSTF